MTYWEEVRNDYFEDNDVFFGNEGDILARISIDAWKTIDDGDEQGCVIACVMLSKHGDILVDYRDGIARTDELAQEAIREAKAELVEYFKEVQNKERGLAILLGSAAYLEWGDIDDKLRKWAGQYFGAHAFASGSRDQEVFDVSMDGLREEDYEKYCLLFEKYDKDKDYEPESVDEVASYAVTLSGRVALGVFQEAMDGNGLSNYGAALATYDGVYFMEKHKADVSRELLEETIEEARTLASNKDVSPRSFEDKTIG